MKKAGTLLALTMMILAFCYVPPSQAQTNSHIIINADGTVSPSTAPIQQDGDTYRLTSDYARSISIQRSNIRFNGEEHTISSFSKQFCIEISHLTNVTFMNLIIRGSPTGCWYGIELLDSTNCLITNNTITDINSYYWSLYPYVGIYISGGKQNTVSQNVLLNNLEGLYIADSSDNLIVGNSINSGYNQAYGFPRALYLHLATNNHFYHNNFLLTEIVTSALGSNNTWDNGFPSGGNYWSNYQEHNHNPQKIHNTELLDVAYVIDNDNIDNYPLADPYSASTPVISILSGERIYNVPSVPLNFNVDQPAVWIGYSLDGAQNVTISGNHTLVELADGQHMVIVYANDSFGNIGSAEFSFTVSVPLSPVLIGAVITIAVAAAVIVGVAYYRYNKASTKHTKHTATRSTGV